MRRQRLFFATHEDLRPGLEAIESKQHLEYQQYETRNDRNFAVFASLLDVPGLGTSRTGATMTDDAYLVYSSGLRPPIRVVPQTAGGPKFVQELTSETLILHPGGVHESGAVVAGRVGPTVAAATSDRGLALYGVFSRTILRGFLCIRSYWVGPEAYRELKAGKRLVTIGISSSDAFDLADLQL
jgi:hypothetical protein